jgi:hypothetical protein
MYRENMGNFKYFETVITHQNDIHEEVKSRQYSRNDNCHLVQNILPLCLIHMNKLLLIKMYENYLYLLFPLCMQIGLSLTSKEPWVCLRTKCRVKYLDLINRVWRK